MAGQEGLEDWPPQRTSLPRHRGGTAEGLGFCCCFMDADRLETSEFIIAKAVAVDLVMRVSLIFPSLGWGRGVKQRGSDKCQWVCIKLKNTKLGKSTTFILIRSKPGLCL